MPTYLMRRTGKKNLARMNSSAFAQEITNTLFQEANKTKHLFESTTVTWASRPDFHIYLSGFEAMIGTVDKVWNLLDLGTSVRYAIMSDPYVRRTHPHFIGSVPGQGRAVKRGHSVQPPRPGIEARGWTEDITDIMRPEYREAMRDAVRRASARMMRGT